MIMKKVMITFILCFRKWCGTVKLSYKKMQNNQKPKIKLSDEQIQRLNDAGFKWCLQNKR